MRQSGPDNMPDTLTNRTDMIVQSSSLSEREAEVLQMVYMGYSTATIAEELGVKDSSISTYTNRARRKAEDAASTIKCAIESGLWMPDPDLVYHIENADQYQD